MIINVIGMNQGYVGECLIIDEEPNVDTTRSFDFLKDSDKPLYDGCTIHNKLSVITQVFIIKLDNEFSEFGHNIIFK